mgnify:CR=1 FL=1
MAVNKRIFDAVDHDQAVYKKKKTGHIDVPVVNAPDDQTKLWNNEDRNALEMKKQLADANYKALDAINKQAASFTVSVAQERMLKLFEEKSGKQVDRSDPSSVSAALREADAAVDADKLSAAKKKIEETGTYTDAYGDAVDVRHASEEQKEAMAMDEADNENAYEDDSEHTTGDDYEDHDDDNPAPLGLPSAPGMSVQAGTRTSRPEPQPEPMVDNQEVADGKKEYMTMDDVFGLWGLPYDWRGDKTIIEEVLDEQPDALNAFPVAEAQYDEQKTIDEVRDFINSIFDTIDADGDMHLDETAPPREIKQAGDQAVEMLKRNNKPEIAKAVKESLSAMMSASKKVAKLTGSAIGSMASSAADVLSPMASMAAKSTADVLLPAAASVSKKAAKIIGSVASMPGDYLKKRQEDREREALKKALRQKARSSKSWYNADAADILQEEDTGPGWLDWLGGLVSGTELPEQLPQTSREKTERKSAQYESWHPEPPASIRQAREDAKWAEQRRQEALRQAAYAHPTEPRQRKQTPFAPHYNNSHEEQQKKSQMRDIPEKKLPEDEPGDGFSEPLPEYTGRNEYDKAVTDIGNRLGLGGKTKIKSNMLTLMTGLNTKTKAKNLLKTIAEYQPGSKRTFTGPLLASVVVEILKEFNENPNFMKVRELREEMADRLVEIVENTAIKKGDVADVPHAGQEFAKAEFKAGRGIACDVKHHRPIGGNGVLTHSPSYQRLGHLYVSMSDLDKGNLAVCYSNGVQAKTIPRKRISPQLRDVIYTIIEQGRAPHSSIERLPEPDRALLSTLLHGTKVAKGLGVEHYIESADRAALDRMDILKGMIQGGNDSKQVLKEMKELTKKMMEKGHIKRLAGMKILASLV